MSDSPGTVVVLHAHPDDEAIFTGATVRGLADRGHRVVLVTATCGEEGIPQVPLAPGETLRARRVAELERACDLLGVARLVLLGYRDSGAGRGRYPAASLGAATPATVARKVAAVVEAEAAPALVHYDRRGIYRHVDHVQVHRAGAAVVRRLGITGYEATVDAQALLDGPGHVLQQAAGYDLPSVGTDPGSISVRVDATPRDLAAKREAMAAHASQIAPWHLREESFGAGYGQEWFVRRGAPGALDELAAAPRLAVAGV